MILILLLFFNLGNTVLNQRLLAASYQGVIKPEIYQLSFGQTESQGFLRWAINHVLPAAGIEGGPKTLLGNIKNIYTSVYKSLFFVDLKNPYTFIRSQFPAIALYDQGWLLSQGNREPVKTDPIQNNGAQGPDEFVLPVGSSGVTEEPTNQGDPDDLGEKVEGIYIPEEDTIVIDSLTQDGTITLDNIQLPKKIKLEKDQPQILIYHTHGTESYQPASEGNYHTLRKEYSVIEIGEIITKELESQGYSVIHDTTYHDYPSFNGSYSRSLSTAKEILKKYPSIKVVLDVHRDGYDISDSNRENLLRNNRTVINNETTTKFQLVIGPENSNRNELETFGKLIKAVSDYKYPGFSKPILVKPYGKYNQYLVDHYALLEVGSNANTIEEAKKAAKYLGDVLGEAIKLISE